MLFWWAAEPWKHQNGSQPAILGDGLKFVKTEGNCYFHHRSESDRAENREKRRCDDEAAAFCNDCEMNNKVVGWMRISDLCRSLKILFAHSAALISILKNKMARRVNAVRLFFWMGIEIQIWGRLKKVSDGLYSSGMQEKVTQRVGWVENPTSHRPSETLGLST